MTPASSQLTDSGALGIVDTYKRHKDTVIAMTKCDQLLADDSKAVKEDFINRLLGRHGKRCQKATVSSPQTCTIPALHHFMT